MPDTSQELLDSACRSVRVVERLAYRLLSEAVEAEDVKEAKVIECLTVGLRRKLDNARTRRNGHGE